jgi:hypothetical protein
MSTQSFHRYAYSATHAYNVPAAFTNYTATTQTPVYAANSYGLPVNVQNGAVLTVARGIFIQNLNYRCFPLDFHSLLLTVGQPVDYRLIRDSRTGTFKGHSTAAFRSQEQAQSAAYYVNHGEYMGMKLTVCLDKDTTAVGKTGAAFNCRLNYAICYSSTKQRVGSLHSHFPSTGKDRCIRNFAAMKWTCPSHPGFRVVYVLEDRLLAFCICPSVESGRVSCI